MNALGDRVIAQLSQRRCQRCGSLLFHNLDMMASYLDQICEYRSEGRCEEAKAIEEGIEAAKVCLCCTTVDAIHRMGAK